MAPDYLPGIFTDRNIDQIVEMSQARAEQTMRDLARIEGIFAACHPVAQWRPH